MLRTGLAMRILTQLANSRSAKVLTPVTAVFLQLDRVDKNSASCQDLCDMIGINRKSKDFKLGIKDRKLYDSFLMLEGHILV